MSEGDDLFCCWLSESSIHVSARRKTEEPPPCRPSGGAEGDSPLGGDAEAAAGGPSGPLHGFSPGNSDTWADALKKTHTNQTFDPAAFK